MSLYVSAATRRSASNCPMCEKALTSKHQIYGENNLSKYFFCCQDCDLGFAYGYRPADNDTIKVLIIQAICPVCHEDHKIEVVGKPDTDNIPCEGCWYTARDRAAKASENLKLPNLIL